MRLLFRLHKDTLKITWAITHHIRFLLLVDVSQELGKGAAAGICFIDSVLKGRICINLLKGWPIMMLILLHWSSNQIIFRINELGASLRRKTDGFILILFSLLRFFLFHSKHRQRVPDNLDVTSSLIHIAFSLLLLVSLVMADLSLAHGGETC